MTMRTTDTIVAFHRPFCLKGVDRVHRGTSSPIPRTVEARHCRQVCSVPVTF